MIEITQSTFYQADSNSGFGLFHGNAMAYNVGRLGGRFSAAKPLLAAAAVNLVET